MRYFKILDKDGKTRGFGKNDNIGIEITEEEYNEAMKPIIEAKEKRQAEVKEAIALREAILESGFSLSSKPTGLRAGFMWKPVLDLKNKSMSWQEVENPDAKGTERNPFGWLPNVKVYANHFYKHKDTLYTCLKNGMPSEITSEFFEKI